ncbi:MAG: hypothetical protein QM758_14415 [Armatimonas sp.]
MQISRLRCEYRVEPLGIDAAAPRLSWELKSKERGDRQTAYQILAGSAPHGSDLWDSGRVASADSVGVVWAGRRLTGSQRVYWKVRVWDVRGQASEWSRPTYFEMGLLSERDWSGARWIETHAPHRRMSMPMTPRPSLARASPCHEP